MRIERRVQVRGYDGKSAEVTAVVELDVDAIVLEAACKAWRNRSRKSTNLHGDIKCRVFPIVQAAQSQEA